MVQRVRTRRSPRPRRKLVWARTLRGGSPTALTFTAEADGVYNVTPQLDEFESAYSAQLIGCTIMRVKVNGLLWTDPPASGSSNAAITWGLIVESQDTAALANVATGRRHADWMWHETHHLIHGPEDTLDTRASVVLDRDIKARRRLDELGDTLRLQIGIGPGSTNPTTLRYFFECSVLIALP